MQPNPNITDSIGFFIIVAALFFSPEVAATIGPYMVIIAAAAVGASFSLRRRPRATRTGALAYFVAVCVIAVLLTVGASNLLAGMHAGLSERSLLAPVAFAIGLIGPDWDKVGPMLMRIIRARAGDKP